ncbi:MAG: caspase family protein [Pseudobacteriovorax sp.]|nr:caspase family protein [Pseudobacteriovorax sp.]
MTSLIKILIFLVAFTGSLDVVGNERYAIVVGANNGGAERPRLRYANSDAQHFSKVLANLAGIPKEQLLVITDATIAQINSAVANLKKKLVNRPNSEVLFYYSGHSDEKGLLLGNKLLPYRKLRRMITALPSQVKLFILDSCSSGALTLAKGGRRRQSFAKDLSRKAKGVAIITSASSDESAQESDTIKGSFFTHYLISALRGAADNNRDRRVTLGEAYQYAYHETLARTEDSRIGPQHPSYDFQLSGKGDIVFTDLRTLSSQLEFPKTSQGRYFLRSESGALVAEINKKLGTVDRIALEPGRYRFTKEKNRRFYTGRLSLAKGEKKSVADIELMDTTRHENLVARGGRYPQFYERGVFYASLYPDPRDPASLENKRFHNLSLGLTVSYSPQLAGLGVATVGQITEDTSGVMFAGGFSYTYNKTIGLQLSFGFNFSEQVFGGQAAAINEANEVIGGQVGLVNRSEKVTGGQIGLVNIAGHVSGFQFGLVSISDQMNGIPLSPIVIVRNGILNGEVWYDSLGFTHLTINSGTPYYYTGIHLGFKGDIPSIGGTMGLRLPMMIGTLRYELGLFRYEKKQLSASGFTSRKNMIRQQRLLFVKNLWRSQSLLVGLENVTQSFGFFDFERQAPVGMMNISGVDDSLNERDHLGWFAGWQHRFY